MRNVFEWKSAIAELKRRKVFRVGSLYLIGAWGASVGVGELFPHFGVPEWGVPAFVIAVFLGFPLAVALAWAFEITEEGVIRDTGRDAPETPRPAPRITANSATTIADTRYVRIHWQTAEGSAQAEFRTPFVIGRDASSEVHLTHDKVSRQHAKVDFERGRWWITDLGSRNGTYLNGKLVTQATALDADNEITLSNAGPVLKVSVVDFGAVTEVRRLTRPRGRAATHSGMPRGGGVLRRRGHRYGIHRHQGGAHPGTTRQIERRRAPDGAGCGGTGRRRGADDCGGLRFARRRPRGRRNHRRAGAGGRGTAGA